MNNFSISLAIEDDEPRLRKLLKTNPIFGTISMFYQKEPNFFKAAWVGNQDLKTIVMKNDQKEIIAFQTTGIRDVYLGGVIRRIGYLTNLRVDKNFQGKGILKEGFDFIKKLDLQTKVPFYYSTVISANKKALRILAKPRRGGLNFIGQGTYLTKALVIFNRKKEVSNKYKIIRGSKDKLNEIVDFLNIEGKKKNFFPHYTFADFGSDFLKDFKVEDFYLAFDSNEIVGVVGKWDQNNFKQNIIAGYSGFFRFHNLFNFFGLFLGLPKLPAVGQKLNFLYLSFIVVKNNDNQIFSDLLKSVYNDLIDSSYVYLVLGLHEKDPLISSLRDFFCITYKSTLFFNYWQEPEILKKFNLGIPYFELAIL